MGARVRILLQYDSLKSSSESMPKASLVQPLVYKSHSCSELTEHKLSLVQRLFRDMAVTTPAPVTPLLLPGKRRPRSDSNFSSATD